MKKLFGVILAGAVMFCALSAAPRKAEAAAWFNCQAMDVFEFSNNGTPLLMVECTNTYAPGVNWAAVQISSVTQPQASRFTTMAIDSVLSGRKFRVYMTDTTCPGNTNCKIASSWALYTP